MATRSLRGKKAHGIITLVLLISVFAGRAKGEGPTAELERNCSESGGPPIPVNSDGWPGATAAQCTCLVTLVNLSDGSRTQLLGSGQICQFLNMSIPSGTLPGPYAVELQYSSGQPEPDCLQMLIEVVSQEDQHE